MTTQSRIHNTDELKEGKMSLRVEKDELEGAKFQLQADRDQFEEEKLHWQKIKKGGSAKMTFDAATRQLNDAKSKYEAAKTQLIAAKSGVKTSCKHLEEQNVKLQNQFSQLQSEISNGQNTMLGLKNDKEKLEAEASKGEVEITRLATENYELKNDKLRVEDEIKESRTELEEVKKDNNLLQEKYKILERMKSGNPKVFFDMTMRGVPVGRIVFELFADNTPGKVEIFRALCTGEKGVSQKGKPLHYKGTSINYVNYNHWLAGGDIIKGDVNEAELIYGDMKPAGENLFNKYTGPGDLCMFLKQKSYISHSFGIFPLRDNTDYVGGYVIIGKVIQGNMLTIWAAAHMVNMLPGFVSDSLDNIGNEAFPRNYNGMVPAERQIVIANSGQLS